MRLGHDLCQSELDLFPAEKQPQHDRLEKLMGRQRKERRQMVMVGHVAHHLEWLCEICLCLTVKTPKRTR